MSDYIKREDATAVIRKTLGSLGNSVVTEINSLPGYVADAYRPKGRWVNNTNGTYTCDRCGCKHSRSNYCPNCGADMRGENHE